MQKLGLAGICIVLSLCWSPPNVQSQVTDGTEVDALLRVRKKLEDPHKYLNWTRNRKFDPCGTNWTGVKCYFNSTDGYLHVYELRLMRLNLGGTLAPELGLLTHMRILNFMWNKISGSIPKEIGKITTLVLLLLSRNQITGNLSEELGNLPNLNRFQVDHNMISGPIPPSLANLLKVEHLHMNDNRFTGQIPKEISTLTELEHVLLDNNDLSGPLPSELALMRGLTILQLDNNNFAGTGIPDAYTNMALLVKLSLRNCSLQGTMPDLSSLGLLSYLDLSENRLTGNIMTNRLSDNITTIILSNNELNGSIPSNFSGLPRLQKLKLSNNWLSGLVPSGIWENITFTSDSSKLDIDLEHNFLSDISGTLNNIPPNVTLRLGGNSVCTNPNQQNISQLCGVDDGNKDKPDNSLKQPESTCPPGICPAHANYEYVPTLPDKCFCAAPFGVEILLRSPSFHQFPPYLNDFKDWILSYSNISLHPYQLHVDSIAWEVGPRLNMSLLFFPEYNSQEFNFSEVQAIANVFARYKIEGIDLFGPYDILYFTAIGPYAGMLLPSINDGGGLSEGAVAGIVLGFISFAGVVVVGLVLFFRKRRQRYLNTRNQSFPKVAMKVDGVKAFRFEDMEMATNKFKTQIGQGGYGKVYKGITPDGAVVAIKRAHQGSLQGGEEFYTEIEMLSRLHHRNLVSLVGYCDEKDEQMLVYEFMPNGSLRDLLCAKYTAPLNLQTRLHVALGASRGILYLHKEADPPIIHRDVKANNILLDSRWTAKVSDFGISKLAPILDDTKGGVAIAHVSTNVKGTPGYVDPEYFLTNMLTKKSDVYSLGVVFLELLTGMQPIAHGRNIVTEVSSACECGEMDSVIDRTMGPYAADTVRRFMGLALRCSMEKTKDRPSMLEIVRELENISSAAIAPLPQSNDSIHSDPTLESSTTSSSNNISYFNTTSKDLYPQGSDLISGVIPSMTPR